MKIKTFIKMCNMFYVNHFLVGGHFYELKRFLLNKSGYSVGKNTKIIGPIHITGKVKIGENCWIGRGMTVHGNGNVIIADNCDIAPNVTFLTGGHEIGDQDRRAGKGEIYRIEIGKGSWIGANSTILKNVEIGSGCVVAACACVTCNIKDNVLVGGVPAKTIREL